MAYSESALITAYFLGVATVPLAYGILKYWGIKALKDYADDLTKPKEKPKKKRKKNKKNNKRKLVKRVIETYEEEE